jgi:hypothetical protein
VVINKKRKMHEVPEIQVRTFNATKKQKVEDEADKEPVVNVTL